jgi:hypothetical protein
MKTAFSPMVGRTRFELVTNGLKARYAFRARSVSPLCTVRTDGLKQRFSPALCQILPTSDRTDIFSALSAP